MKKIRCKLHKLGYGPGDEVEKENGVANHLLKNFPDHFEEVGSKGRRNKRKGKPVKMEDKMIKNKETK